MSADYIFRIGILGCLSMQPLTGAPPERCKTNTFVTDFDEFQKCADIRMRYFGVT